MNRQVKGLLIGIGVGGVVISSLLVLILREEKSRRFLQGCYRQVLVIIPGGEQVERYAQQAATRVSQLADNAKGTLQETVKKVKRPGSDMAEKVVPLTSVGS